MKKKLIIGLLCLIVLIAGFVLFINNKTEKINKPVLTKVESYKNSDICEAAVPSCGYCPGIMIKDECFVDKTKLTDVELQRYGLK